MSPSLWPDRRNFWLLWWVLCLNVTAGIGVLGQASAMAQEMFPGRVTALAAAAGFVGLLSLFNMGRPVLLGECLGLHGKQGDLLRLLRPRDGTLCAGADCWGPLVTGGGLELFVFCFVIIISMYGGGFATIPAYLKDVFGVRYVGAIHGALLTAWSAKARVFGPKRWSICDGASTCWTTMSAKSRRL